MNVKDNAKKVGSAITAKSKKVTISLLFLATVIVDKVWLEDTLYGVDSVR